MKTKTTTALQNPLSGMKIQKHNKTTLGHVKYKENCFRDGLCEIANDIKRKKVIFCFSLNRLLSFIFSMLVVGFVCLFVSVCGFWMFSFFFFFPSYILTVTLSSFNTYSDICFTEKMSIGTKKFFPLTNYSLQILTSSELLCAACFSIKISGKLPKHPTTARHLSGWNLLCLRSPYQALESSNTMGLLCFDGFVCVVLFVGVFVLFCCCLSFFNI